MTPASPLTPDEIAAVRKPVSGRVAAARPRLPRPGDPRVRADQWFRRDWIVVGRESDVATPGTYCLATVDDEPLIVVRGARRGPARLLQRLPASRHGRRRGAMREGGPLPVPVPRLDLRPRRIADPGQAHGRPRRLHLRRVRTAAGPGRDVAGLRVHQPGPGRARRCESGWATSVRISPGSTSATCASPTPRPTRSTPTGSSSPRTTASATTARASTRSSTS